MFRSSTIIREPALKLDKVIFMLNHLVKLRHYLLYGRVAACCGVCCMQPHDRIINNDVISLNVLT